MTPVTVACFLTTSLTELARAAAGVSAQGCVGEKVASCQAGTLQEEYLVHCVKEEGFAHKKKEKRTCDVCAL